MDRPDGGVFFVASLVRALDSPAKGGEQRLVVIGHEWKLETKQTPVGPEPVGYPGSTVVVADVDAGPLVVPQSPRVRLIAAPGPCGVPGRALALRKLARQSPCAVHDDFFAGELSLAAQTHFTDLFYI